MEMETQLLNILVFNLTHDLKKSGLETLKSESYSAEFFIELKKSQIPRIESSL